ncbi:MAG: PD-(D/E)XK nuclease family protein [Acidimicrobiales bacterium]
MLADLLAHPGRLGEPATGAVLDEAAGLLDDAATLAVRDGGWSCDDPLRLSKGPVGWLLRCPRRAVAGAATQRTGADRHSLAIGLIVDAGAKLATLTGRAAPVTVDAALEFLAASGDPTVDDYIEDAGPEAASELRAEASEPLDRLAHAWPLIDPSWWPRVEEPVRVRLADGAVTLGGRLDMLLGGPPTQHPGLVVEVKSGRWQDTARADAHFYGLLLGLRDSVAPAAVVTVAAGDASGHDRPGRSRTTPLTAQVEPIRPVVLRHTAERVAVALGTAARLAAGEPPAAHPGSHCVHCPLRATCPEAMAAA